MKIREFNEDSGLQLLQKSRRTGSQSNWNSRERLADSESPAGARVLVTDVEFSRVSLHRQSVDVRSDTIGFVKEIFLKVSD